MKTINGASILDILDEIGDAFLRLARRSLDAIATMSWPALAASCILLALAISIIPLAVSLFVLFMIVKLIVGAFVVKDIKHKQADEAQAETHTEGE